VTVRILSNSFHPCDEVERYQERFRDRRGRYGAAVSFVGTMRDFNAGATVESMTLEHYPGMTEKQLLRLCDEARARWHIVDVLIVHRVGVVVPGDPIVLVAVWSAHRAEAFDGCRYLIEELKTRAPFWKREQIGKTGHWVAHNTPRSDSARKLS
jgi:molybdopterin synthase catalytic subunit